MVTVLVGVATSLLGFATLAGFASPAGWLPDLASAFRFQYAVLLLVAAVVALASRRFLWGLIAAVLLALNVWPIAPLYVAPPVPAHHTSRVRIVQLNVQSETPDGGRFGRYSRFVSETSPDLLAIEDLGPAWASAMAEQLPEYRYQKYLPIERGGGIGLFSRIEIEDARFRYFTRGEPGLPSITARIRLEGAPVDLVITHPLAPTDARTYRERNDQLSAIAAERERWGPDLIVVGDLNVTSWSAAFGDFASAMGLNDTRKGFGVQPSWPAAVPRGLAPIDHCLASPRFSTIDRRIGPGGISVHFPVFIELGFTPVS